MLKPLLSLAKIKPARAAAFGRLCVETGLLAWLGDQNNAAAFGRLCVETKLDTALSKSTPAAAFGRLCVETATSGVSFSDICCSRLRAAVC